MRASKSPLAVVMLVMGTIVNACNAPNAPDPAMFGDGGDASASPPNPPSANVDGAVVTAPGVDAGECAEGAWDHDGDPKTPCIVWSSCVAVRVGQPASPVST